MVLDPIMKIGNFQDYSCMGAMYLANSYTLQVFLSCSLFSAGWADAGQIIFPANAFSTQVRGAINVTASPFNANGNDVCANAQDNSCVDTQALQNAIKSSFGDGINRFVYIPNGTYYIDTTLLWKDAGNGWNTALTLIGESQQGTIIRLRSNLTAFGNVAAPKAMIKTANGGGSIEGKGNSAFFNYIQNLTLDVGDGNPSAIGVDFLGNNNAGLRDVTIRSATGVGKAGLAFIRTVQGPALFKNVTINGFQYGIWSDPSVDPGQTAMPGAMVGSTFEHLTLNNQSVSGIFNYRDFLHIRDLQSTNSVPAIDNGSDEWGSLTLVDARLSGGAPNAAAIVSRAHVFLRDVSTTGYQKAYQVGNSPMHDMDRSNRPDKILTEYTSHPPLALYGDSRFSLRLPVLETPEYFDLTMANWQEVPSPTGGDDFNIIAAALGSGKTTVWFHPGIYMTSHTLNITGGVRHLLGMGTTIKCVPNTCDDANNPWPFFDFQGTADLRMENLQIGQIAQLILNEPKHDGMMGIRHTSPKTLSLVKMAFFSNRKPYQAILGAGNLFIEDVGQASGWKFAPGQKVWARQFDLEGDVTAVVNEGADLWVLGLKTETAMTVVETKAGGNTEILGGMLHETAQGGNGGNPGNTPAFINNESSISLSFTDNPAISGVEHRYNTLVQETRFGTTRLLSPPATLDRVPSASSIGTSLPLYGGRTFKLLPPILGASQLSD